MCLAATDTQGTSWKEHRHRERQPGVREGLEKGLEGASSDAEPSSRRSLPGICLQELRWFLLPAPPQTLDKMAPRPRHSQSLHSGCNQKRKEQALTGVAGRTGGRAPEEDLNERERRAITVLLQGDQGSAQGENPREGLRGNQP